ncbi:MAG: hypothetical protein M1820_006445 [Bogoriella megaspora]|nr:MAG: hypothetical protein M1820_006445 [Bogoriella megaspora]
MCKQIYIVNVCGCVVVKEQKCNLCPGTFSALFCEYNTFETVYSCTVCDKQACLEKVNFLAWQLDARRLRNEITKAAMGLMELKPLFEIITQAAAVRGTQPSDDARYGPLLHKKNQLLFERDSNSLKIAELARRMTESRGVPCTKQNFLALLEERSANMDMPILHNITNEISRPPIHMRELNAHTANNQIARGALRGGNIPDLEQVSPGADKHANTRLQTGRVSSQSGLASNASVSQAQTQGQQRSMSGQARQLSQAQLSLSQHPPGISNRQYPALIAPAAMPGSAMPTAMAPPLFPPHNSYTQYGYPASQQGTTLSQPRQTPYQIRSQMRMQRGDDNVPQQQGTARLPYRRSTSRATSLQDSVTRPISRPAIGGQQQSKPPAVKDGRVKKPTKGDRPGTSRPRRQNRKEINYFPTEEEDEEIEKSFMDVDDEVPSDDENDEDWSSA